MWPTGPGSSASHSRIDMSDIAISVRGLSKSYPIVHNAERHTVVAEAFMSLLRNPVRRMERETFWSLKGLPALSALRP